MRLPDDENGELEQWLSAGCSRQVRRDTGRMMDWKRQSGMDRQCWSTRARRTLRKVRRCFGRVRSARSSSKSQVSLQHDGRVNEKKLKRTSLNRSIVEKSPSTISASMKPASRNLEAICKTCACVPKRERTNSVHVLTTYKSRGPFRVILSSFVSTKSVIDRDHGRNVIVFMCSALVRIVSSSSFNTGRTPGVIRQMGQHVLFSDGADKRYRRRKRKKSVLLACVSAHASRDESFVNVHLSNRAKLARNESCAQEIQSVLRAALHGDAKSSSIPGQTHSFSMETCSSRSCPTNMGIKASTMSSSSCVRETKASGGTTQQSKDMALFKTTVTSFQAGARRLHFKSASHIRLILSARILAFCSLSLVNSWLFRAVVVNSVRYSPSLAVPKS